MAGNGEDDKAGGGNCKDNEVSGGDDGQDDQAAGGGEDKEAGDGRQQSRGQVGNRQGQLFGQRWRRQEQ